MSQDSAGAGREGSNPWSSPGFIAAVVVAGLLGAAGLYLLLLGGTDPHGASPVRPARTAARAVACGVAPGDQTVPVSTPAGTRWTLIGTMAAPTSPQTVGPTRTSTTGIGRCFAHSPLGALYAAATAQAYSTDPELARSALGQYLQSGSGRDAVIGALDAARGSSAQLTLQIAGFRFESYRPSTAMLDLLLRASVGTYVSIPTVLHWADDDWKLAIGADLQSPAGAPTPLASAVGYVPWVGA